MGERGWFDEDWAFASNIVETFQGTLDLEMRIRGLLYAGEAQMG
jgi:hypothetical protein